MNKLQGIRTQSKIRAEVSADVKAQLKEDLALINEGRLDASVRQRTFDKLWGSAAAKMAAQARYDARMYHLAHMVAKGRAYGEVEEKTHAGKTLRNVDKRRIHSILRKAGFEVSLDDIFSWVLPEAEDEVTMDFRKNVSIRYIVSNGRTPVDRPNVSNRVSQTERQDI